MIRQRSLFATLVIGLGTMMPSSPGYVGTYEFFLTRALALLNLEGSGLLSFALAMHTVTFVVTSIIRVSCLALRKFGNL